MLGYKSMRLENLLQAYTLSLKPLWFLIIVAGSRGWHPGISLPFIGMYAHRSVSHHAMDIPVQR
jgi:hypothetical protein